MADDEILKNFENLLSNLEKTLFNLSNEKKEIKDELTKWKCEITVDELELLLSEVLIAIKKWQKLYIEKGDISIINLDEYDNVSKDSAYILGECSLIDEINIEAIDWQIGIIGNQIISKIKERDYNNF